MNTEVVPKRFQCEHRPYPSYNLQDLKRLFTKTRFRCNFCSDKSVQTCFGPFQEPIRYRTFHFQHFPLSRAVLFRSRKCLESSVSGVNRVCEHSLCFKFRTTFCLNSKIGAGRSPLFCCEQWHSPIARIVKHLYYH